MAEMRLDHHHLGKVLGLIAWACPPKLGWKSFGMVHNPKGPPPRLEPPEDPGGKPADPVSQPGRIFPWHQVRVENRGFDPLTL